MRPDAMEVPVEVPVGTLLPYAGPINVCTRRRLCLLGWLFCDGSAYREVDFPELFAVIRQLHGYPEGTQGQGHFNVPDCRGMFLRGVNFGANIKRGGVSVPRDPDAAKRAAAGPLANGNAGDAVGSVQLDAFQGHEHNYTHLKSTPTPQTLGTQAPTSTLVERQASTSGIVKDDEEKQGAPRDGLETRPLNLALHFLIKARSWVHPPRLSEHGCVNTQDVPQPPGRHCGCVRLDRLF